MEPATRLTIIAELSKGGSLKEFELIDFPGVTITKLKERWNAPETKSISYNGKEYASVKDAVSQWNDDNSLFGFAVKLN